MRILEAIKEYLEVGAEIRQPQAAAPRNGLEQARQFNREHRLTGRVLDEYKDWGFDSQERGIDPSGGVIVVDRIRDTQLQKMIEQAKAIQGRYGTGLRTAYELSKLVYEKTPHPIPIWSWVNIVKEQLEATPGREVLLGDITVESSRHYSLLFQVLAAEVGLKVSLVRGNVVFSDYGIPVEYAWNELELHGKLYLVDIMNPPGGRDFENFDYTAFMRQGGFPKIGVICSNYRYMDVNGVELYRV